ncbi:GGDEF domain-containing response regulator [Vibrio navarrensis]|uniref:diguanylate cyclase n=1 Tax=Vibrio navarrensis TaxID=29495 RepID=A0A099LWQ3_9VIBR|nr:diguanylate cyclase [Vibrio navarrensis]KGK11702.1 diguanylate cyclase [Vibrio navarrensis]MBE3664515.1 diguanylate cyclase response regulator [Vibrio navarrensis]MBE4580593.1 diguanylate cyclase response regulator [Vibrio navarrensis]MBE4587608.1 diguanylate cyclase response regulator [Vibrio navarrensis]MBE4608602.1 diguanylate cyclase response regulator [Vibrio navarrensis]
MQDKATILIVDDKIENLLTLEGLLDAFSVNVVRATSGEEALALTLDYDFALVLLDVQMPTMNGYEVAELMRGNRKTRHIPIIFVTAASKSEEHIFRGYEHGAVDYLFKPLHPLVFHSKVRVFIELFEQRHALKKKTMEFDQKLSELEELQQQLEETNEQLLLLSTTDSLTGLHNRRRFEEIYSDEWNRALRSNTSVSMIIFDIDHFKMYNDTFGHQQGDECLRMVAEAIRNMKLRCLDKVARIGGEEFAAILPETDLEGAKHVADRIRTTIEALRIKHSENASYPHVTASLGICSMVPQADGNIRLLLKKADEALYKAKRTGRNRIAEACHTELVS